MAGMVLGLPTDRDWAVVFSQGCIAVVGVAISQQIRTSFQRQASFKNCL
jgi:hypothetical protein